MMKLRIKMNRYFPQLIAIFVNQSSLPNLLTRTMSVGYKIYCLPKKNNFRLWGLYLSANPTQKNPVGHAVGYITGKTIPERP